MTFFSLSILNPVNRFSAQRDLYLVTVAKVLIYRNRRSRDNGESRRIKKIEILYINYYVKLFHHMGCLKKFM